MANFEQRTADTYELVKLIAETLNSEVTRIDGIDNGVNGVGADVIRLTASLADIKSTIEAQKNQHFVWMTRKLSFQTNKNSQIRNYLNSSARWYKRRSIARNCTGDC